MRKIMKLSPGQIAKALGGVVEQSVLDDEAQAAGVLARATFSVLTEPGDRFAGWLLARYPAVEVVETLQSDFDFRALLDGSARDQLSQLFGDTASLFAAARERWQPRLSFSAVEKALEAARRLGAQLIVPTHSHWPASISLLGEGAPHCLWVRGDTRVLPLVARALALVGSRLATSYGEMATTELVSVAVEKSLAIVSGGAYGIDAIAHRATLALDGFTVAVLAGGIDRLYPAGNLELLNKIGEQNILLTEQPPGASPTKWRFLQRNRLIAALGSATVVVEAGARSGALSTANHAIQIGRPVGAIPGRFDSPQSAGCHELIRRAHATLIATPEQAIDLALGSESEALSPFEDSLGAIETRLLDALGSRALTIENIAFKAGLTSAELSIGLGNLELRGLIRRRGAGWVKA